MKKVGRGRERKGVENESGWRAKTVNRGGETGGVQVSSNSWYYDNYGNSLLLILTSSISSRKSSAK